MKKWVLISVCSVYRPANREHLEEITLEEAEFGQVEESAADTGQEEAEIIPGIDRILSPEDQDHLTDDETYIVYLQPLIRLARLKVDPVCSSPECGQIVEMKLESVGSALYIKWVN